MGTQPLCHLAGVDDFLGGRYVLPLRQGRVHRRRRGARLSTQEALNGLKNWRLHLTILAFTFVLYPILGLATDVNATEDWTVDGTKVRYKMPAQSCQRRHRT